MSRTNEFHVLQGRSAGFVTRLFAYLADFAVIAGLIAVTGWLAVLADNVIESLGIDLRVDLTTIFLFFTPFLIGSYFVVFWSLTGRTVGKWFMGLKVVGCNGRPPSIGRSLLRLIGYVLSAIALWAGYFWVIIDNERQGWHDHLAKTWVIYDYERQRGGDIYERYRQRTESS